MVVCLFRFFKRLKTKWNIPEVGSLTQGVDVKKEATSGSFFRIQNA
jgi:hypothetical protein